jgi:hypothetical protein
MVGTVGEELIKRQYVAVSTKVKLSIKRQGAAYLVIWWDAIYFVVNTSLFVKAIVTFCRRCGND